MMPSSIFGRVFSSVRPTTIRYGQVFPLRMRKPFVGVVRNLTRTALLRDSDATSTAPTRVFGYPFGLSVIEPMVEDYLAAAGDDASQLSTLDLMVGQLATERHALDLDAHLRGKCANTGSKVQNDRYLELAGRVDILEAKVEKLEDDSMMIEKFDKQFVIYPPPTTSVSSTSVLPLLDGLRFDCHWSMHRHRVRQELSTHEYRAHIRVTPFRVVVNEEDGSTSSQLGTALTLVQASESKTIPLDDALFEAIRTLYGGESMPAREFGWFLSFLGGHPSDHAFDVISGQLDPTRR